MSNEQLMTSVNNWDITQGSDKFNTLPPEQIASFAAYRKEYDASQSWNKDYDKDNFANNNTNIVSTTNEEATVAWFTWLDIRAKYTELLNAPDIKASSAKITELENEVNAYNDELDLIEDQVKENYSHLPSSAQASIIADRQKSISTAKNKKINEYNSELGNYTRLKDNVSLELEFAKYEDAQNREIYTAQLEAYTAEQDNLTDIAKTEFENATKIRAVEVKLQNDKELAKFKEWIKPEDKWGKYITDRNWKELYVVNGVATEVKQQDWDLVYTEQAENKEYNDSTYSKDWVYTTVRSYEDWREPEYFTYDITGKSATWWNMVVNDLVSGVKWDNQCGEAVNKYVTRQLGVDSKDFWMSDSYESKKRYIDSETPQVWGVAIWNSQWAENWHTWIVTGYNIEEWTVEITDWNWNTDPKTWKGDEQKFVHDVAISDIVWSDWGFYNPNAIPTFWEADISVFNSLTASEKAKRQNETQFRDISKRQSEVFADENADPFDVISFSKWGKDMSTTDNKEIRKYSAVLNSLWEIQETIIDGTWGFFGEWTWPFQWLLRSNDPYDVTAQKLKAQITSLIPNLARWVYWEVWVLTEADVALYKQTVPNLTQTEDVNRAMLWMTLRLVKRWLETSLTDLARAWTDTSWFEWKLKSINSELEILERDLAGKVTTPTIKPSNKDLLDGYNKTKNAINLNYLN
jgi:hypothetical protein